MNANGKSARIAKSARMRTTPILVRVIVFTPHPSYRFRVDHHESRSCPEGWQGSSLPGVGLAKFDHYQAVPSLTIRALPYSFVSRSNTRNWTADIASTSANNTTDIAEA